MNQNSKLIVVVEDEADLLANYQATLEKHGFKTTGISNQEQAVNYFNSKLPDLVILDIGLGHNPDAGFELCQQLRQKSASLPILMLTARDDEMIEAASLNTGADNYLKKPVRSHLLLAHIQALLRRSTAPSEESVAVAAKVKPDIALSHSTLSAELKGKPLLLTSSEFELLAYFMERAGFVIPREDRYQAMRGIPYDGIDRSIDLRVSMLRRKLQDDQPPYRYIKTVRGRGYLMSKEAI